VKEVQELANVKLDEVQKKMHDYDDHLKKLEGIVDDKCLDQTVEL